jgi:hypothetical protein
MYLKAKPCQTSEQLVHIVSDGNVLATIPAHIDGETGGGIITKLLSAIKSRLRRKA